MTVRPVAWGAALVLALTLTACKGAPDVDPDLTKYDAKAIAQTGETTLVDRIDGELVTSVDQQSTGSLQSCAGDGDYRWSGGTDVALATDDVGAIIDDIVAIDGTDGWRAQRETSAAGDPRAAVYGPDGDVYIVDGLADRREISIASGSPCFHLPDGESTESF